MDEKEKAWTLYYLTIVGWAMHPGYLKPGTEKPNLEQCARIADEMLVHHDKRFGGPN